ncbi:MAG TPA: hypothetical protein EYQ14_11860 [Gammaproteobacteria bacterium]|nr:hypothetical protein [Gammaproteobacteria bacterium]HIL98343.1 hypothetical protein [Pseudomonadales bacterium]
MNCIKQISSTGKCSTNKLGNKLYLAGRIEKRDQQLKKGYRWGLVNARNLDYPEASDPVLESTYHTSFSVDDIALIYTGPYTLGDDHGSSHQPFSVKPRENHCWNNGYGSRSHGSAPIAYIDYDTEEVDRNASSTFKRAMNGIAACDVFFVWLDDMEAFGTLVEIGYAKAAGKHIVLAVPPMTELTANNPANSRGELWFAHQAANEIVPGDSAKECFEHWVRVNYTTELRSAKQ